MGAFHAPLAFKPGCISDPALITEALLLSGLSTFWAEKILNTHNEYTCAWGISPIMIQPDGVISPMSIAILTERLPIRLMLPAFFNAAFTISSLAGQFP
jgi:hypothetical protein